METIFLETFKDFNFKDQVNIITVYEHPADFRDEYIARLFWLDDATPYAIRGASLEEVRDKIPETFTLIPRVAEDDKVIVEAWLG